MRYNQAKEWQKDSRNLETEKIQVWSDGGSMMGVIPRIEAQEIVNEKRAFVICAQAIGFYDRK